MSVSYLFVFSNLIISVLEIIQEKYKDFGGGITVRMVSLPT